MTSQPPRSSLLTSVLQDKEKGLLIPQTDINKTNQIKANLKQLRLLSLQGINMALVFTCPFSQDEVTYCLPLNQCSEIGHHAFLAFTCVSYSPLWKQIQMYDKNDQVSAPWWGILPWLQDKQFICLSHEHKNPLFCSCWCKSSKSINAFFAIYIFGEDYFLEMKVTYS